MSKTKRIIAAVTAALMTISSSALIQANAVEETLNVSLMSSSKNETKEYNFNDIYAMTTEEVLSLFAEKGLTKDKGYYVYGQGDDAEYVYCFSWNVYLFSEDFLSDRTVEKILNDYTPYQDVDCLYDKGESLWDTDRIVSALALPEEYFEITVFKKRVIVKGADSTDKNKIACNCEIRCKLPEGEKRAAMRNAALNYLQLRKDFDKLLIDDAVPYYGKEKTKTAAQKYGDAIAEYMANNDIQGVVSRSVPDEKLSIGFHGDHEAQLRAYISEIGLDKSGIPYEFEKLPDFSEFNDLNVTTVTQPKVTTTTTTEVKTPDVEKVSALKETAEDINEYMRSNGISGSTHVHESDGIEKIFISYDGFFEEIQAYVKEKGIDENLVVYQQSYDHNTNESTLKGDANCDNQVDLSYSVMIMQALANPNKYGIGGTAEKHLTEQGQINGDMDGDGLTVGDAQAIQRKLLGLDEKSTDLEALRKQLSDFFAEEKIDYTVIPKDKMPEQFSDKYVFIKVNTVDTGYAARYGAFLKDNNIDISLIKSIPYKTDSDTELNKIRELLYCYILENNINASVDPTNEEEDLKNKTVMVKYTDSSETRSQLEAFLEENNIDPKLIDFYAYE